MHIPKPRTIAARLRSRRRRIAMALCFAAAVLAASYFVDSFPLAVGGETATAQWMERAASVLGRRPDSVPDSILLVNVAYDKTLVPYEAPLTSDIRETRRLPAGRVAVTDRAALLRFLSAAAGAPYRYIMLDIRFDDDLPADSVTRRLFALIDSMPRIVFACHEDARTHPLAPARKSAYSDYHTSVSSTDMVKYPLLKRGRLSIPAAMYSAPDSSRLTACCGLTFDRGRLCRRSTFISAPVRASSWTSSAATGSPLGGMRLNYHNLGADILAHPAPDTLVRTLAAGRIIVIGDFIDDTHNTYTGPMPGPLVNLNTYISLCRGEHLVRPLPALLLLILYFLIAYGLIGRLTPFDYIPLLRRHRSVVLRAALSFVGFTTFLSLAALIFYLFAGEVYSVVFPSLCFTILSLCSQKTVSG